MALRIYHGMVEALYLPPHDGNLVGRCFIEPIERVKEPIVCIDGPFQSAHLVSENEHDDDLQNAR